MSDLLQFEKRLKEVSRRGTPESTVSSFVRDVLIHGCSWRAGHVREQRRAPRGPVDFAVNLPGGVPCNVEVKAGARRLRPEMIEKYLALPGRRLVYGILTNGVEWELWLGGSALPAGGKAQIGSFRLYSEGSIAWVAERLHWSRVVRNFAVGASRSHNVVRTLLERDESIAEIYRNRFMSHFHGKPPSPARFFGIQDGFRRGDLVSPEVVAAAVAFRQPNVVNALRRRLRRHFGRSPRDLENILWAVTELPGIVPGPDELSADGICM